MIERDSSTTTHTTHHRQQQEQQEQQEGHDKTSDGNAEFELEIDRRVETTIKADLEPALDRRLAMTKAEYR
jgi:hypothetical protein